MPKKKRRTDGHQKAERSCNTNWTRSLLQSKQPSPATEPGRRWQPLARLTEAEIQAGMTNGCGVTRKQLAAWGLPWPPPKGWKRLLLTRR